MYQNFDDSDSNSLAIYQKILWICSLGYKDLLNFAWHSMKFYNCHHASIHVQLRCLDILSSFCHASCCLFAIVCRFKMPLDTTWCVWVHADIDLKTSMLSSCRFWWVWVTSFWRFYNYLLAISSSFVLRFLSLPSLCLYLIVPPMKLKRQRKIYQK